MKIDVAGKMKLKTAGTVCREDIELTPVLQEKIIEANGEVTVDEGFAGISKVTVKVPDKTIMEMLTMPGRPKFGRLKVVESDGTLTYKDVFPRRSLELATTEGVFLKQESTVTASSYYDEIGVWLYGGGEHSITPSWRVPSEEGYVVNVPGAGTFTGFKEAAVCAMWKAVSDNSSRTVSLPAVYIPPFTAKVAVVTTDNVLSTKEYVFDGKDMESISASEGQSGIAGVRRYFSCVCNPPVLDEVGDITDQGYIVACEFVYPKADITLTTNYDDWSVSVDDGATWTAVTDGMVLEQVEHFYVRNGASFQKNIGNGTDGYTVPAYGECVVLVSEDATWNLG